MPSKNLVIAPLLPGQLPLLRELAEHTFVQAFGPRNRPENIQQYVAVNFNLAAFQKRLDTPGITFYLGWLGTKAVAYLQLNTGAAQNEQLLENALELERIYVQATHQGLGLGQQLLEFAIKEARQLKKKWIWLGVWDQNTAAIRFYERHGFVQFDQHEFYLGSDRQLDFLLKKAL